MRTILSELQQLIAENKQEIAANQLLAILENGEKSLYERAKKRIVSLRNTDNKAGLLSFLEELNENYGRTLIFLSSIKSAQHAYSNGNWQRARAFYQNAKIYHQESFSLSLAQIQDAIEACRIGQQYDYFIDEARKASNIENWSEALGFYQEARQIHLESFSPDLPTLDDEIELCQVAINGESPERFNKTISFFQNHSAASLGGITTILLISAIVVYMFNTPTIPKKSSSASTTELLVPEPLSQPELPPEEPLDKLEIKSEDKELSSTDVSTLDDEETSTFVVDEESEQLLIEDEERIKSSLDEILSDNQLIEEVTQKESAEEEKVAETPPIPRIAILPFCDDNPALHAVRTNVYMDATYALSNNSDSKYSFLSRNAVKGSLKRLNISQVQSCQVNNLDKIAYNLQATHLLIGKVGMSQEGEIQLIYEQYDHESKSSRPVIELKSKDIQNLRIQLKSSIQTLF